MTVSMVRYELLIAILVLGGQAIAQGQSATCSWCGVKDVNSRNQRRKLPINMNTHQELPTYSGADRDLIQWSRGIHQGCGAP